MLAYVSHCSSGYGQRNVPDVSRNLKSEDLSLRLTAPSNLLSAGQLHPSRLGLEPAGVPASPKPEPTYTTMPSAKGFGLRGFGVPLGYLGTWTLMQLGPTLWLRPKQSPRLKPMPGAASQRCQHSQSSE